MMGNNQPTQVDLLKTYLMDPVLQYNMSSCFYSIMSITNETLLHDYENDNLNVSNAYNKCVRNILPSSKLNQPYILPWWQQFVWISLFGIMILIAAIGNAIVAWIIVAHRRMRTITNYFLLNLALADFLLATFNAFFNFIFMLNSHWPFGTPYCVISNFVASLTVSTSVFTILAVSIDRFIAIVRPLRPRMTKITALFIIIIVWILGSILSLPSILFSTTITYRYPDQGERTICFLVWPDGASGHSLFDHMYNIMFLVITYAIPMSSMAITYTWMGCVLWGSKVIGEQNARQSEVIRSKQRVVHMLIAVVLLFGICWLPYHIYFLYTYHHQDVVKTDYIQHIYLAIYWLAMSNSMYNPIVYYWMNGKFRNYFRTVLCFYKQYQGSHPWKRSWPLVTRTATFTCSSRTRSCRVTIPASPTSKTSNLHYRLPNKPPLHMCCEL